MTSYRRIDAVEKTIRVLRFLADQRDPAAGTQIARALDLPAGTVMCHLVTLEDAHLVRRVGEHFELGDGLALFWARRKAQMMGTIDRMKTNLREIGVEAD